MKKIKLQFMVDPEWLRVNTYVEDPVKVIITDPETVFLMGILGESGREMVAAGFPFYFTRPLADKLINKGIAVEIDEEAS